MFFIFQLIILIYIIIVIYYIIELKKYNIYGKIISMDELNDDLQLNNHLKNLNPLHTNFHNYNHLSFGYLMKINPFQKKDSCHSMEDFIKDFNEQDQNYFFKQTITNVNLKKEMSIIINHLFDSQYFFPIQYSLSLFQGKTIIPLQKCNHNYNIIGHIEGDSTIYLFNPKHKDDIIYKDNSKIKKWGQKITMKKNDILFIPNNWYYIQEINNTCIQFHIDIDTYFSFIPNFFK